MTDGPFENMTWNEKVSWASGELIIAIGEGKFREALYRILNTFAQDAHNRGVEEGIKKALRASK